MLTTSLMSLCATCSRRGFSKGYGPPFALCRSFEPIEIVLMKEN